MRIALDYGGVITFDPDGWKAIIADLKVAGHEVFLLSHAISNEDFKSREKFAIEAGIANRTFVMDPSKEEEIRNRKATLAVELGINLFLEDSPDRAFRVALRKTDCVCLFIPQVKWQVGQKLLKGLLLT